MIDSSSSGAAVTGTLDASHDAHNRGVVDVETSQGAPIGVPSPGNLADLIHPTIKLGLPT
jgi:hypothetical protein